MLRHPPEILITTPESLNLLLASEHGSRMLAGVATVILDEIHAVAPSRRGTHLMTAVERLVLLAGEVQRIALSATVRPLERVAAFVGGQAREGGGGGARLRPREVRVVEVPGAKRYELRVCFAAAAAPAGPDATWEPLVAALRARVRANRSTLVFVNGQAVIPGAKCARRTA